MTFIFENIEDSKVLGKALYLPTYIRERELGVLGTRTKRYHLHSCN